MRISIVVPVLNEAATIEAFLRMAWDLGPHEVIVSDGGSVDGTRERLGRATLVQSTPGRGPQLNAGAAVATGEVLLFLHADVRLEPRALEALRRSLEDPARQGGIFDARFEGEDWIARAFDTIYHWRRYVGIFYGDAGIFVRRDEFARLGGFRPYPILEDYEFGRRLYGPLWKFGRRMAFLEEPIFISDRRWRRGGLLHTVCVWVIIQTLFCLGFPAERLGWLYRQIR